MRLEADEYVAKMQEAAGQVNYLKAKLVELKHGSRPQEIAKANADLSEVQAQFENARVRDRPNAGILAFNISPRCVKSVYARR